MVCCEGTRGRLFVVCAAQQRCQKCAVVGLTGDIASGGFHWFLSSFSITNLSSANRSLLFINTPILRVIYGGKRRCWLRQKCTFPFRPFAGSPGRLARRRLLPLTLVLLLSERFLSKWILTIAFSKDVSMLKPATFRAYYLWCEFLGMEDWSKMLFQIFSPDALETLHFSAGTYSPNGTGMTTFSSCNCHTFQPANIIIYSLHPTWFHLHFRHFLFFSSMLSFCFLTSSGDLIFFINVLQWFQKFHVPIRPKSTRQLASNRR